jgi:hypothetical protein
LLAAHILFLLVAVVVLQAREALQGALARVLVAHRVLLVQTPQIMGALVGAVLPAAVQDFKA